VEVFRNSRFLLLHKRSAFTATFLIALLALSACSSASSGNAPSSGTNSGTGSVTSSLKGTTIVVTGEAGSVQAGYNTLFAQFTAATGIKVQYVDGVISSELEQIKAQGAHPATDIFLATPTTELQYPDLWQHIDAAEIPNLKNLPANLRTDPIGVTTGDIPNAIEYNAAVFKQKGWAPPTSYMDFFNPKYKGHVALYPASFATMEEWLAQIAPEFGGSTTNMGPVFQKLTQLKPQLYTIVSTPTELDQAFIQGNAWIGLNNTTRINLLNQQTHGGVALAYPSEGILWLTGKAMIPKNDPNPKGAFAFLNWFLTPKVQDEVASLITESPAITGATVPSSLSEYLPNPNSQKGFYPDWAGLEQYFPSWIDQWNKIFTG
jgi:putative spermidine/putrescine transport system substrate-binding protein